MNNFHKPTLLVTGASGHLGQRVLELLLEAQTGPIIATTRTPEKLAAFAVRGVTVRQADFDDVVSLRQAFAGADRLLLISTDTVDGTDRRAKQHSNAVKVAAEVGVKHVIYTSLIRPEPGTPITLAPDHYATEQALAASSLDWTVLRNNVYTDGLLQSLPRAVAIGQLMAAAGTGGTGFVTREDCARAAAAALAAETTGRKILDVTGPAVVTHAELAQIAQEVTGRPVTYVPVPAEAMKAGIVSAGLPAFVAELIVSFDEATAQGVLAVSSSTVQELTGRPAQSVREFLAEHRAALLN
jgi:NAD(P)H dehydrogenase (quinone)